jgi:hypothetical protein
MQGDCNFLIYKGQYTTAAERLAAKYVVASTNTANPSLSNCHLNLQRDGNFVLYADITTIIHMLTVHTPIVNRNAPVWSSQTSDGGNADFWLVLLDIGKLEIHAGTTHLATSRC